MALETGLPIAVVRKEPKAYGTMSQIEGQAPPGAEARADRGRLDDRSPGTRRRRCSEEAECRIGIVVLAIDRGGAKHLRDAGYWVKSIVEVEPRD